MSRSFTLALKDVKLLIRDKSAMFWVIVFPLLIAILFGSIFGGSNTASAIGVAVIDSDHTPDSAALAKKLSESKALKIEPDTDLGSAKEAVRKGNLAAYILIPKGYGEEARSFQYANGPALKIGIDPSRQAEAGLLNGVLAQAAYQKMSENMSGSPSSRRNLEQSLQDVQKSSLSPADKESTTRFLKELDRFMGSPAMQGGANGASSAGFTGPSIESEKVAQEGVTPASPFEVTFPQALLWGLLGVISTFAISLVKEREQGTLTRLRASPMSLAEILAGKALACFLACTGVMVLLLAVGHFFFGVRLASPVLLAMAIGSGAFCVVGIMMLLSVIGRTEQAVSGSAWGVMIVFAMFGGGMIPVFMMPGWMQSASNLSPLKWTVLSIEGAIWRGFSLQEMLLPCFVLLAIGIVTFSTGVRVFRART